MSRYTDFEVACLTDAVQSLHSAVRSNEPTADHLSRVFSELGHVYELLGLPDEAAECTQMGRVIDGTESALKDKYEELDDAVTKALDHFGLDELDEMEEVLIAVPEGMTLEAARDLLKAAAEALP